MEIDLSDSTAIVTGASQGIGQRIAVEFAKCGADVVGAARTKSTLEETIDEVTAHGVEGLAVPTDLREVGEIDGLVDETVERFGTPNILINNAGVNITGSTLDRPTEEVDTMFDTNLRGAFLLSQRFGQAVRESGVDSGSIVNISSVHGRLGTTTRTIYASTKAGLYGLTRGLAAELAPFDVTVNSVSPGLTEVGRVKKLVEEKGDDRYDLDAIPLHRLAKPEEIAYACLFLSSPYAAYVTGIDLLVDGGVHMTAGLYE